MRFFLGIIFFTAFLFAGQCQVVNDYFGAEQLPTNTTQNNHQPQTLVQPKEFETVVTKTGLYLMSYKDALKAAKRFNRKVMVIVAQASCSAWQVFGDGIFNEGLINKYLKDLYFVALIPTTEVKKYPQYVTNISPTIYFIDKDENLVAAPLKGAPNLDFDFAKYLLDLAFYEPSTTK